MRFRRLRAEQGDGVGRSGTGTAVLLPGVVLAVAAAARILAAEPVVVLDAGDWRAILTRGAITELLHRPTNQLWSGSGDGSSPAGLTFPGADGLDAQNAEAVEVRGDRLILHGNGAEVTAVVERQGADLIVTQQGVRSAGGMVGMRWGLTGGPGQDAALILPHRGGMTVPVSELHAPLKAGYPYVWEAPLVIVQGAAAGLAVWAEDPALRFKTVTAALRNGRLQLGFETQAWAPFEQCREIASATWRIMAYAGDWRVPAQRYRAFMQRLLQPRRPADFAPWAAGVRFVLWVYPGDFVRYLAVLRELAAAVDPAETLLIAVCTRQSSYDRNYPDYTPYKGFPDFVHAARELGYHVAAWSNFTGVSPRHPLYERVRSCQYRDPFTGELMAYESEQGAVSIAFINPACTAFRQALTAALAGYCRAAGMDAIHLDVSGALWNDANGMIDGCTVVEGHRRLHRELIEALPGVVFSGEGLNEITLGHESFAQRWNNPLAGAVPHPISAFLFNEFTRSYGYCMPKPGRSFENLNRLYEGWGVLPTLRIDTVAELHQPGAQRVLRVARAFQDNDLEPDFGTAWGDRDIFRWRGRAGVTAVCRNDRTGVVMECGAELLYRRLEGVNRAAVAGSVFGWHAYNAQELFGLDPSERYYVTAVARDLNTTHISALPGGVVAADFRLGPGVFGFQLRAVAEKPCLRLLDCIGAARTGVVRDGVEGVLEPDSGASFTPDRTACGRVVREVIYAHPPWRHGPGATFGEFTVTVPDVPDIGLDFAVGLRDGATGSDGVVFLVGIDGKEAFREHVLPGAWHERRVPLSDCRGRTVTLRFTTDPGPRNETECDWAAWADPCLRVGSEVRTAAVEVVLPGTLRSVAVDGAGPVEARLLRSEPTPVYVFQSPVPAAVQVAYAP